MLINCLWRFRDSGGSVPCGAGHVRSLCGWCSQEKVGEERELLVSSPDVSFSLSFYHSAQGFLFPCGAWCEAGHRLEVGSASMVLAEIPLAEEIVVKRVVVEGVWDGGRWSVQDVFSSVQARPADILFWASDILESEVVMLGLTLPGMTALDVSVIWRSTARTMSNFTGRAARWIGAASDVRTASPFLSCTVSDGHAASLANILGYEDEASGWSYGGFIYDLVL